jgi:hypothetical protein
MPGKPDAAQRKVVDASAMEVLIFGEPDAAAVANELTGGIQATHPPRIMARSAMMIGNGHLAGPPERKSR